MPTPRRRVFPWQPLLLISVVVLGVAMIWRVRSLREMSPAKVMPEPSAKVEPLLPAPEKKSLTLQPPPAMMPREARETFDKAVALLSRVLLSPTHADWEKSIRHPLLTMPRLRADDGRWRVLPDLPLQIGPKFGITDSLLVTTVRLKDGTHRPVAIEKKGDQLLLDWESLTGWGEERLEDIASGPDGKFYLVRVKAQAAVAKPPFPGQAGLSLVLSHPAGRRVVNAMVSEKVLSSSPAAKTLAKAREGLFTLRVRPHTESRQHGWIIVEEVICTGWITDA